MAIGIELKDSVIKKLKTDFIDENNKTRNQVKYYFTDCKGRGCQGLGMYHKRKTDRKVMILDYWVNDGKERILSNGKKITIKMSVDDVSEERILNLESILRNVNGTQSLNFTIWDAKEKIELSLPSRNTKIKISKKLLATLDQQDIRYKLN